MSLYGQELFRNLLAGFNCGDLSLEFLADGLSEFTNEYDKKVELVNEIERYLEDLEFLRFSRELNNMEFEDREKFRNHLRWLISAYPIGWY